MQRASLIILVVVAALALAESQFYVPRAYYTIDETGHESIPVPLRRLRRSYGNYPSSSANANANANAQAKGWGDSTANANANAVAQAQAGDDGGWGNGGGGRGNGGGGWGNGGGGWGNGGGGWGNGGGGWGNGGGGRGSGRSWPRPGVYGSSNPALGRH